MSIESPPTKTADSARSGAGRGWLLRGSLAVLRRPDLWMTALRVGRRHAPERWWTRRPYLPVPDREWMAFRFETALADAEGRPTPEQIVEYLEWARSWR